VLPPDGTLQGTSKNRSYSSDATKLSPNDSASFPFRFMDVHARAARDPHREQFFEVPYMVFPPSETGRDQYAKSELFGAGQPPKSIARVRLRIT
jgi:hypothetical protein